MQDDRPPLLHVAVAAVIVAVSLAAVLLGAAIRRRLEVVHE